jgi:hypothetical protein
MSLDWMRHLVIVPVLLPLLCGALLGLAGAVYLVYVLEILKWRSEPGVQIVLRRRAAGDEVPAGKR